MPRNTLPTNRGICMNTRNGNGHGGRVAGSINSRDKMTLLVGCWMSAVVMAERSAVFWRIFRTGMVPVLMSLTT